MHDAVRYVVDYGLQHRTVDSVRVIGVDEIQYAKGHKYLTLVCFHIMAKMNEALDAVRVGETRQLRTDGYQPVLSTSRWCVLKRKENLTAKQQVRLRICSATNLWTVRAYLLKEDFQWFWEYISPAAAGKFLDFRCAQTLRSRIEPMKKVARTLRRHRELLLAANLFNRGAADLMWRLL